MVDVGRRRRALRRHGATVLAALTALALADVAPAERVVLDPTQRPRIVNGINTHGFPSAGALLYSGGGPITSDNAGSRCSGTLIGCETFLVAAHCVDDLVADHYLVYLQHAGLLPVVSITRHPSYDDDDFPLFDVAVVKLGTWVTGIAPAPINQTDPTPFIVGATGIIVGFGRTDLGNDYGIKRAGTVETVNCPSDLPAGADDDDVLCWNFLDPIDPPGTDSNTCNGDSGGPMFIDFGGGLVVAGVTSGGTSIDCLPEDNSYDANVFTHRSFILGELGADSAAACGGLAPVGDAQTAVVERDGILSAWHPSDIYSISVPAGANALRVTLNSEDNGLHDVNLYVKQGPGASATSFDCAADGASVFGACTVDLPAAGTWSIAVERGAFGAGEYQLTATVFGGAAPTCGSNGREFNEDCDGSDDAQCPGQCQADCRCPPVCTEDDLTEIKARITPIKFKVRGTLQNLGGAFSGDPRQGFTLRLTQGANTATVDIPAGHPGWVTSKPERGRYKWSGALNGITRVKAIDRTAKRGFWKIIVAGDTVPGAGAINLELPVEITLAIDGACTSTTF